MLPNLTKENFFDALRKKFPLAMDHFCAWIDLYKLEVGWNELFGAGLVRAPKFHEMPIEMQAGIMGRYLTEQMSNEMGKGAEFYARSVGDQYKGYLENNFSMIEAMIKDCKVRLN